MFSRFFIDRPIFAAVLSIAITLGGALSLFTLPIAQFPRVTPPTVQVSCNYPGASARDVAGAVAAPIEQFVNGVEGMMFMSSSCTNDGSYSLTVTFHQGINIDMAQVLVQNRVNLAIPMLPDVIKATGVATRKRPPDILMGLAMTSPGGRYSQLYLSNFALRQVRDELLRMPGVADVMLFGQRDFSMRVWLDPARLAARSLSAGDVVRAIREQNSQLASGSVGQPPVDTGQEMQITLDVLGRLKDVEQFENIVIKVAQDGRMVRLKDVARVELGSKSHDVNVRFDGRDTIFLAIFQLPDANALSLRDRIMEKMAELAESFPDDIHYEIAFDTTPYTRESINEVFKTLRDAIILVAVVVLLFLQNWRSALIPLIAVPVAIIGTFSVMAALGFSLNNLTLFGLVLSIGIVVDDAIVVVEAVEHHIELGMAPRQATIRAMEQVSGPVVAVGLVLSAVFVPCAFISGITGLFFRQFALTIAVSTIISAFNSLTLSPALTALLLRSHDKGAAPPLPRMGIAALAAAACYWFWSPWAEGMLQEAAQARLASAVAEWGAVALTVSVGGLAGWLLSKPLNRALKWVFECCNAGFTMFTGFYAYCVGHLLRLSAIAVLVYGGLLGLTYLGFLSTPKGFIPSGDMGYLLVNIQLPDSASLERTYEVLTRIDKITRSTPGVRHATVIAGQSFVLNAFGSNFGSMFVNLKDYKDRQTPETSSEAIANRLRGEFAAKIFDANVAVFGPPPVRGVGRAGGFAFVVEDRDDLGLDALQDATESLVARGNEQPGLVGMFSVFRANVPQLEIKANPRALFRKGVSLEDFADTLRVYQGSLYVNDLNLFDRTWQVIVQAEGAQRNRIKDLSQLKIRNDKGQMVPLGSLASIRQTNGPLVLTRYNMYTAATINGSTGPGMSSAAAIDLVQRLAKEELPHMAYEWTDMSYLELLAGNTAMIIFAFAVVMVFLVLAAQYESWSLPMAVILVVPLCLLSAIVGVRLAGMDINIFTQIGFVVLVGLSSKNAILIVEFAKKRREAGDTRRDATLQACRLRLRPIVMTSLAFILGVLPLMLAHGAGAEMRRTLGTAVFSGMVGVTLFGIVLTPVFFYLMNRFSEARIWGHPALAWIPAASAIFAFGRIAKKVGKVGKNVGRITTQMVRFRRR
ncbi:MAG: efflux RND transporter permease subunit [Planctomycetes bacterium]|nr:efflux RND transporter permease subunit [Planctomycetota bacterium]